MAKTKKDIQYYEAVGRRREAVSRVRLYIVSDKEKQVTVNKSKIKQGDISINNRSFEDYFPLLSDRNKIIEPLQVTGSEDRFAVSVQTKGGGKKGQVDAIILGIARSLCLADDSFREKLKPEGFLTRDSRVRERRKVGTGGKARRKKQSPKR